MVIRTTLLTLVAMVAFAANSLLCRLALGQGLMDAASFATVRVIAGAVVLSVMMLPKWRHGKREPADWWAGLMLFVYMIFFSFAYISLGAGTGALILFGAVQLTMFGVALAQGEHFSMLSWVGFGLALGGLVYLVSPGLTAPDWFGATLMAIAGVAWGIYSLLGRKTGDPLAATANNFIVTVPLVLCVSFLFRNQLHATYAGIVLAVSSGAIASGVGYVIWYAALRGLTGTRAATVQLSVPVIAALGAVVLLAEPLTLRLVVASIATLGGVWVVLFQRSA